MLLKLCTLVSGFCRNAWRLTIIRQTNNLFGLLVVFLSVSHGYAHGTTQEQSQLETKIKVETEVKVEDVIALVKEKCGSCHNVPSPSLLPKKNWPHVIDAMRKLSNNRMGHEYITVDDGKNITALYYGSSPEALPMLPYHQNTSNSLTFSTSENHTKTKVPLVTNIHTVELSKNGGIEFLVCDPRIIKFCYYVKLTKYGKKLFWPKRKYLYTRRS